MRISLQLRLSLFVFYLAALVMSTAAAPTFKPKVARPALSPGGVQQETQSQKGEAPTKSRGAQNGLIVSIRTSTGSAIG